MSYITHIFKLSLPFFILLLIPASSVYSQVKQSTPQELGQQKAAATRAKDKAALKSLIHPKVVEFMQKNEPAKLQELLNAWTVITIPENYLFAVKPVSEIREYNAQTQTMNLAGQPLYFPVPPTHFMVFVVEQEQTVDVGGKEEKKTVKIPLGIDPIREENGKWYILLPGVKE